MRIVGERRWPCCGRHLRVDFGPGDAVVRRCRACKRRYMFVLEDALTSERMGGGVWRLVVTDVTDRDEAGVGGGVSRPVELENATAVICDVGGHDGVLERVLASLGADVESGDLPRGLRVVQVGDLVRLSKKRGAGSDRCVEIVDRFLTTSPDRWTQLAGNHELACIGGFHMASWDAPSDVLNPSTIRTLSRWWDEGGMEVATLASFCDKPILVTHAGLTHQCHKEIGLPPTPIDAAMMLNEAVGKDPLQWGVPGVLVTGVPSPAADCLWADAGTELYPSWVGREMPFTQIHGHSQVFDWGRFAWRTDLSDEVKARTVVDPIQRRVRFDGVGGVLLGIDWTLTDVSSVPEGLPPVVVSTPAAGGGSAGIDAFGMWPERMPAPCVLEVR